MDGLCRTLAVPEAFQRLAGEAFHLPYFPSVQPIGLRALPGAVQSGRIAGSDRTCQRHGGAFAGAEAASGLRAVYFGTGEARPASGGNGISNCSVTPALAGQSQYDLSADAATEIYGHADFLL